MSGVHRVLEKIETWRGMVRQMRRTAHNPYWQGFRDGQYNSLREADKLVRSELLANTSGDSRHAKITAALRELESVFGSDHRLSLLVRHTSDPEAHSLTTIDSFDVLRRTLDELEADYVETVS